MNHNNTIYQSKNYDKFRFLESNRMVDFRHVRRLKKSIADIGLIEPIVVNDHLEVIDGQHRLQALKELDEPVTYIVSHSADKATVMDVNNTQKNWSLSDYVTSQAIDNPNYKALTAVIATTRKQVSSIPLRALAYIYQQSGQPITKIATIKQGKYKFDFDNSWRNDRILAEIIKLDDRYRSGQIRLKEPIMIAVKLLSEQPAFDLGLLYDKLTPQAYANAFKYRNPIDVIEVFLKCYNRRLKPAKKIQAYQLPNKKIAFQVGE